MRILRVGMAVAALLTFGCTASPSDPGGEPRSSSSSAPSPSGNPLVDPTLKGFEHIQHVIFIVQENRSFDHYFGTFPGADGIPMRGNRPAVCAPDPVTGICARPYHEDNLVNIGGPHSTAYSVGDVNGGRMDGFIEQLDRAPRSPVAKIEARPSAARRSARRASPT